MKRGWIIGVGVLLGVIVLVFFLYEFQIIPHPSYNNEHFQITTYKSLVDKDEDGVDDQTDILQSAKEYLATNPKYKSKYYGT